MVNATDAVLDAPGTSTEPDPEDIEADRDLRRMKIVATSLLAFTAMSYFALSALPSASLLISALRATMEAATIGGFADWFAVVALFRQPLGLPIPHTDLIA